MNSPPSSSPQFAYGDPGYRPDTSQDFLEAARDGEERTHRFLYLLAQKEGLVDYIEALCAIPTVPLYDELLQEKLRPLRDEVNRELGTQYKTTSSIQLPFLNAVRHCLGIPQLYQGEYIDEDTKKSVKINEPLAKWQEKYRAFREARPLGGDTAALLADEHKTPPSLTP